MFFPPYLIVDLFMLGFLGFLLASILIALVVIIRSFRSPYQDKKDELHWTDGFWSRFSFVHSSYQDETHYEGMKQSLVREAESLAKGLSCGE